MIEEMQDLEKEAWDFVRLLDGRKLVGMKWVFKNNLNAKCIVEKYKVHLVGKDIPM